MKIKKHIIAYAVALIVVGGITFAYQQNRTPKIPRTFEELIQLSDEEIENFDIARMNLLCAKGLPGSEDLDIEQCLQKLDQWAEYARAREAQDFPGIFFRNREYYKGSLAFAKGIYLVLLMKQELGCTYNHALADSGALEDRKSTRFFHDPSDIFIHGLLLKGKGTCSSMPVLTVAIGNRCKHPLYLVACGGHLFSRWDDGTEKYNIEITSISGVNSHSDEYYMQWPRKISEKEIREDRLMSNMTAKDWLATFASLRSVCFQEHKKYTEAIFCEQVTLSIKPNSRISKIRIEHLNKLKQEKEKS